MLRSKVRLVGLALIPAAILLTGHSSLGETKGDECKAKPDGSAPAGLHWYYRVDRANNRHCWYLHQQGMPVHSLKSATSRNADPRNDNDGEQIWKIPPVTGSPKPDYQQSTALAERPAADFVARWVDLPKSVDLNTHEPASESIGYAAEAGLENKQEQLPPAWANVSAANAEPRQNAADRANFGSVSLAGAVLLALLLMSEALVQFARRSGRSLLRLHLRADPRRGTEHSESAAEAAPPAALWQGARAVEPIPETQSGINDLRRLLQRAGAGLGPAQSFAPSGPMHRHEDGNRARAQSAFERLKSRSFNGMTWALL
jgi:hypothetical protein